MSGSSMIACASPSRWRIPSEYLPTCFLLSGSRPTLFIALRIACLSALPLISARNFKLLYALNDDKKPGVSMITPTLSGISTSLPIVFPFTLISPDVSGISPQIHFISTVLPLPFLPISPHIVPVLTLRSTCLSARLSLNCLQAFSASIA